MVRADARHLESRKLFQRWAELARQQGKAMYEHGAPDAMEREHGQVMEAAYDLPYQAHATPEPMNCTAHVRADGCDIWAPTQNQQGAREIAARITGLDHHRINVRTTYLGGGFGRRAMVDYVGEAVEISKAMATPVKVIWTREEDIRNDYYRPATHNRMRAVIDDNGVPRAWLQRIVGADVFGQLIPAILPCKMPEWSPFFAKSAATYVAEVVVPRFVSGRKAILGAAPLPYSLPNMRVEFIDDDPGIPLGWWRSVAHSSNCFAVESFVDEIAAAVGP